MEIPLGLIAALLFLLIVEGVAGEDCTTGLRSTSRRSSGGPYSKIPPKMFMYRMLSGASTPSASPPSSCDGKSFYDYDSFITAADSFPAFGNSTGPTDVARRDVAAFLANVVDMSDGFCYIAPLEAQSYCNRSSTIYPCANGKNYYARGPLRLTGNNNYGAAGEYLKLDLLRNPDKVSQNSTISFQTAIWLWMNGSDCHRAIVSGQGFAATVKALNSSACDDHTKFKSMVNNYNAYCNTFRVSPGNLGSCNDAPGWSPSTKRNPKSLNPLLLGGIGGTALVSCLLLFTYWLRARWRRRYSRAGQGEGEESRPVYFNYQMLREATKGFDARNKLGQGGFGEVFKTKADFSSYDDEAEGFPITSISNFYESEELVSLATHEEDQLSAGQMFIEISKPSPQFPDLQIKESCSNFEEQDFQRLSYLQLEYQKHPSSCEYVISNYDKEEDVEISESFLSTRTLFSSILQQRDDQKCVLDVVDVCYKSVDQNYHQDQNSRFEFAKDTKSTPQFSDLPTQEDCNRYKEDDEIKILDQKFIMHSPLTEILQSVSNIQIYEGKQKFTVHSSLQIEDSVHISELQKKGSCNNLEEHNLQKLSYLHKEHQEEYLPFESLVSDFYIKVVNGEEHGEGKPNFMVHSSLQIEDSQQQLFISQLRHPGRHLLASKEEFMQRQLFSLSQNIYDIGFRDPVADLMELYISDPLKISDFVYSSVFTRNTS